MKSFISSLSFFAFFVLFVAMYFAYDAESYNALINSSSSFDFELTIPEDDFNSNPAYLQYLKQSAMDNSLNLIRTVSYYDHEKDVSYTTDYIYLTTSTMFFENIPMKEGRILEGVTITQFMY